MDLGSSNIHERLGSLSKNDNPAVPKKDDNLFMKPGPGSIEQPFEIPKPSTLLVQRCVIVQRDEKGYGLTVSGDNPVFVQSVKEDGAAAKAGVQTGDRIIKVNGSLVTQCNHIQVVELIRSGTHVALTLLGRAPGVKSGGGGVGINISHLPPSSSPPGQRVSSAYHGNMSVSNKVKPPSERVTAPQPVDAEKQQQLVFTRLNTVKLMLEQEKTYLEKLKSDYAKSPSDKIKEEMMRTKNRVKNLEYQLCDPTGNQHQMLPHSPPPLRSPVDCHPWSSGRVMSDPPPPPPPPRRNLPIQSQMSLPISSSPPVPPVRNESRLHSMIAVNDTTPSNEQSCHMPPPPPPPLPSPTHYPMSYSMDNIQKMSVSPGEVWSNNNNYTHSRQRSSPDAILHQTENLRQQVQGGNSHAKLKNSHDLSRSHSEITGNRKYCSNESYAALMAKKRRSAEGSSRASSFGAYDSTSTESPRVTPPGTPPPPYSSFEPGEHAVTNEDMSNQQDEYPGSPKHGQLTANNSSDTDAQMTHNVNSPETVIKVFGTQLPIMSLDDDDLTSDTEMGTSDDYGPFECLVKLLKHQAHLAVFLRYMMLTNDPSSLFFYLISDIYKQGAGKEIKKWAYEIHSTFLLPGAPLRVKNIDDAILRDIGVVLQTELDKEETLRKVFWKARKKASEELKEHLKDICHKKTLGCISLYGASDVDLEETIHDKNKEAKLVDQILLRDLELWMTLQEPVSDRASATASALATLLLKVFGIKNQSALSIIERVPTFVSKDKSRIKFLKGNKKVITMQGHHFVPQHYFNITYCNHCQLTIWGVGNQGYQCQTCELNIHKACINVLEEMCVLAPRASKKDKKRVSGLMENIIGKTRKPSNLSSAAIEKAKRLQEEGADVTNQVSNFYLNDGSTEGSGERATHMSRVERLRRRYEPSKLTENEEVNTQATHEDHSGAGNGDVNSAEANGAHDSSKKGTSITRSESLRTRREQRPSFRKRSDPNIPRSNSDVDVDDRPVSGLNQSGSSSNSSLSAKSIDSPSNSLEAVHRPNEVSPLASGAPIIGQSPPGQDDSDFEVEADPPNWAESVDWEIVRHLKPKEKKRQDVINELFHTERNHVRNLKVLHRVFYHHMKSQHILQPDQIKLLFANLEDMVEIHGRLSSMMKAKRRESQIVEEVGEMMLQLFDGADGVIFREAASNFCRNQSVALESLKSWQKKDQKLAQFLIDASTLPVCRRLQLKDIIPTAMQRLTKYPLLLENLAKYTSPSTTEYTNLMRALDCSKDILNAVNQAVKEAEDNHRLQELQRKIDRGPFEKVDNPLSQEFKNLDVTRYKLHHEGQLSWRINRQKTVDMHALVLDEIMVLLQKQDEKFVLKFHNTNMVSGKEETKLIYSPIIKMANLLPRNVATDKKAFFLVSTSTSGPQIYELVALSHTDRKTWIRHITEAAEAYKIVRDVSRPKGPDQVPQPLLTEPEEPGDAGDDCAVEASLQNRNLLETPESQEISGEASDTGEHSDTREPLDTPTSAMGSTLSPESKSIDVDAMGGVSPTGSIASGSSYSGSSQGPSASPSGQRRFMRVETLQIAEGPPLIEPSEVVVYESAVLQTAEPVLTPIEKLRRKDQAISKALEEKQQLVADILHIPRVDFAHVSDIANDSSGEKEAKELVLAAIVQATHLAELINENLSVTEIDAVNATTDISGSSSELSPKPLRKVNRSPGVPVEKLVQISGALHVHLTQLLSLVTEREEERERLRQELRASREQIHLLHESRRRTPVSHSPSNSISQSRPNSFISVGSSTSELGETTERIPLESDEDEKMSAVYDSAMRSRLGLLSVSNDLATPLIEAVNCSLKEQMCECEDSNIELFVDASESSTDHVEEECQKSDNIPITTDAPTDVDTPVQDIDSVEPKALDEPSASAGDVH